MSRAARRRTSTSPPTSRAARRRPSRPAVAAPPGRACGTCSPRCPATTEATASSTPRELAAPAASRGDRGRARGSATSACSTTCGSRARFTRARPAPGRRRAGGGPARGRGRRAPPAAGRRGAAGPRGDRRDAGLAAAGRRAAGRRLHPRCPAPAGTATCCRARAPPPGTSPPPAVRRAGLRALRRRPRRPGRRGLHPRAAAGHRAPRPPSHAGATALADGRRPAAAAPTPGSPRPCRRRPGWPGSRRRCRPPSRWPPGRRRSPGRRSSSSCSSRRRCPWGRSPSRAGSSAPCAPRRRRCSPSFGASPAPARSPSPPSRRSPSPPLATALAVPLAGLAARRRSRSCRRLAGAGLAGGAAVTGCPVLAVAVGALGARGAARPARAAARARGGSLAAGGRATSLAMRSGADVLAAGLAVAGCWQLRVQPPVAEGTDAVRAARARAVPGRPGVLLALRLLPPLLGAGDRAAGRSRALVLPLAAVEAARRPQATAGGADRRARHGAPAPSPSPPSTTWDRTQHDAGRPAGRHGPRGHPRRPARGSATARPWRAATGGTVSPATRRPVPVGQWVGEPGAPPELVAVDATRAGAAAARAACRRAGRGRASGRRSAPPTGSRASRSTRPPRPRSAARPRAALPLRAVPRLVLQDAAGLRVADEAGPVRLDGRLHPLALAEPVPAGAHVVAVDVLLDLDPAAPAAPAPGPTRRPSPRQSRTVPRPPGRPGQRRGVWSASSPGDTEQGT